MQASERDETLPRAERVTGVPGVLGVSMRELLASCVAARVVSTPPEPPAEGGDVRCPEAA